MFDIKVVLKSRGNGKLPRDTERYHAVTSRYGVILSYHTLLTDY